MIATIIIIISTIILSALFSGMEISFLSSNKLKLQIEKKQSRFFNYVTDLFTKNSGQFISTILVGNNVMLAIYSMQMVVLINAVSRYYNLGVENYIMIETIISTVVIIFAAEFIPKNIVRSNPNFYFRVLAFPAYVFYLLFYPFSKITTFLSKLILRIFGLKITRSNANTFDKVDLAHLLEEASENERGGGSDMRIFQNALEFPDMKARECMVPRIYIYAIDKQDSIDELKKMFIDTRFSRILVYENSIDNIVGYVNSKSLFRNPSTIAEVLRPVTYVPESMKVDIIFSNLIKNNLSIAIVIDEFGGTAGMITQEDILEEIFGEIEDEHDSPEMVEKTVNDNEYIFSGRLEIDYLNEKYRLGIPENDNYETLAGYIIFSNHGLPKQGDTITNGNKTIQILEMGASKIELVKIIVR